MSEYIRTGTQFPKFYQFPDFLLRAPISQTAKLTYMVLYDRARLSKKNDWVIDGKIYTVYPIAELAEVLGRSKSTIKTALNELADHGMLIRKSGGFAKANILYVLIPDKSQFSDEVLKLHSNGCEKAINDGAVSIPTEDSIPATNKVNETNNSSKNNGVMQRSVFGKYKNVCLTEEEYAQLRADYPYRIDSLIEELSSYMAATGKIYKNHEAALRNWANRETMKHNPSGIKPGFPDYSYEEGESY